MSSKRSMIRATVLALAAVSTQVCISSQRALAADGSWTGAATPDNNWATPGNWDTVPGVANGTFVNTDIATFADATNGNDVTVDLNRNIGGMVFNTTAAVSGFAIGTLAASSGNTLYLTGGGMIDELATNNTTSSPVIHAPIVIMGNSYTMRNNSTNTASGLKFNSGFKGGASGALTVTLSGSNSSGATTGNNHVLGPIEDGAASSLSIVKEGTGVWELRPTFGENTYSGDTIVNGGLLRLMSTVGSMSPNSNYIINGGILRPNFNGVTGKSIKVNSGGTLQASADAVITSLNATSGPSLWFNFIGTSGPITMGAFVNFIGTTSGQGGFKLSLTDAAGKVSYSKGFDLGSVQRPFEIDASATNAAVQDPDLQINNSVNGNGGGMIKMGPGVLKFNNASNGFTGTLEIQQGVVRFNSPDALTNKPPVLLSGGELDVAGAQQTIGALQINSGTISASSGGGGVVATPGISMNVAAGQTAQAGAVLADSTGPAALLKTGAGTATLTAINTYTGGTTVNQGVLRVGVNGTVANGNVTATGTGTLAVSSGRADPLKVAQLAITGSGRVDLNDNDLIVTSGSSSAIRPMILAARNGGSWDGVGLTSSAARNATPRNRTLGLLTGAEFHQAQGAGALFGGQTVADTDVLVKFTWYGDADFNGVVNFDDYSRIDSGFANARTGWLNGDFDLNDVVNFDDYSLIDSAFNTQSGTLVRAMSYLDGSNRSARGMDAPSLQLVMDHFEQFGVPYAQGFLTAVPEPSVALLAALPTLFGTFLRRRRRNAR